MRKKARHVPSKERNIRNEILRTTNYSMYLRMIYMVIGDDVFGIYSCCFQTAL